MQPSQRKGAGPSPGSEKRSMGLRSPGGIQKSSGCHAASSAARPPVIVDSRPLGSAVVRAADAATPCWNAAAAAEPRLDGNASALGCEWQCRVLEDGVGWQAALRWAAAGAEQVWAGLLLIPGQGLQYMVAAVGILKRSPLHVCWRLDGTDVRWSQRRLWWTPIDAAVDLLLMKTVQATEQIYMRQ